jgi:hypothetical protein
VDEVLDVDVDARVVVLLVVLDVDVDARVVEVVVLVVLLLVVVLETDVVVVVGSTSAGWRSTAPTSHARPAGRGSPR